MKSFHDRVFAMSEPKETVVNYPIEGSITVKVGEKLRLNFTEDCRPCWDPEDQGLFDHPLPHGDHKKGHHWTGTAVKNGTIACSSVPYGEKCHQKPDATPDIRTITVGGGG
jgi:hypothetical protein